MEASRKSDYTLSPDLADVSVKYLMSCSRWNLRAESRDTSLSDSKSYLLPTKKTMTSG